MGQGQITGREYANPDTSGKLRKYMHVHNVYLVATMGLHHRGGNGSDCVGIDIVKEIQYG